MHGLGLRGLLGGGGSPFFRFFFTKSLCFVKERLSHSIYTITGC